MARTVTVMATTQGTALLTVNEAAEELLVSRRTIYRYIADGALPTVNIGREGRSRTRVSREALTAYIRRSGAAA
jgi:excisionase family DNA binding protein